MLTKKFMPERVVATGLLGMHGFIAFFGALVHALNAHRHGDTKSPMDILVLTVISSFSGVMFAFVGLHFFSEGSYITLALAGTGGYMGVEGMGFLIKIIKKSILSNIESK